ncbi:hypothetical protein [Desulfotomaculum sp. 1211_IL3151]|uniref:hypothetical protein n=1 Tax=Desulfotomaculum sp. 1211_IL3151 TaxID=3084055 RepID=UPI002FDA0CC3
MQRHSREHIREQRQRTIKRRLFLAKHTRFTSKEAWENRSQVGWWSNPGRLSKYNLVCSCGMCRDTKYRDERHKHKSTVCREIEEGQFCLE